MYNCVVAINDLDYRVNSLSCALYNFVKVAFVMFKNKFRVRIKNNIDTKST